VLRRDYCVAGGALCEGSRLLMSGLRRGEDRLSLGRAGRITIRGGYGLCFLRGRGGVICDRAAAILRLGCVILRLGRAIAEAGAGAKCRCMGGAEVAKQKRARVRDKNGLWQPGASEEEATAIRKVMSMIIPPCKWMMPSRATGRIYRRGCKRVDAIAYLFLVTDLPINNRGLL